MSYISGRMCSLAVQTLCAKSPSLVFVGLKIAKQMNLARPCTLISLHSRFSTVQEIQSNISSLQLKKRLTRKKLLSEDQTTVVAFSTAEEYDLERLVEGLKVQDLYETKNVDNSPDVVHAVAKYEVGHQVRDIFFFREGSIVLWNVSELESSNLLNFLRTFQQDGYAEKIVHAEAEVMSFAYLENG